MTIDSEKVEAPEAATTDLSGASGFCPNTSQTSTSVESYASLSDDEDLVLDFVTESSEHLSIIEANLLRLEENKRDIDTLNAIFRAFHTIKGLAGFLLFSSVQGLAHEVESLLDLARNRRLELTPEIVDLVLESTDVLRLELQSIRLGREGKVADTAFNHQPLILRVRAAASAGGSSHLNTLALAAPATGENGLVEKTSTSQKPAEAQMHSESENGRQPNPQTHAATLRIETSKLNQLMDLVGELVVANTLIAHNPVLASLKDARLVRDLNLMVRITTSLQKVTTQMRMVPIGRQFQRMAHLIRDLSRRAAKEVTFETDGDDTELDKTIAEELSDPILHMVRNSIDHGIESTEERIAAGKRSAAVIRIIAKHCSEQIVVEISDDGRGLDRERIIAKAVQKGLVRADTVLTDAEAFLLIFEAGFTTAETITDISGRGVGLDVVWKHVQKLRGRIEVESETGRGTTFRIIVPLTLAIIDGLKVRVGVEDYIVPLFCVKEIFRPTEDTLSTVHALGEMVLVRDVLLPIVRLHERFAVVPRTKRLTEGVLLVIESSTGHLCLFVDELAGKQEVVIKSLGGSFKNADGIAGCAILGDGRVGLVLDVDVLLEKHPNSARGEAKRHATVCGSGKGEQADTAFA